MLEPELPEPELLPAPELPVDGELDDGELPLLDGELPDDEPEGDALLPPELLPFCSFMHLSRSAPVRPAHLLLAADEPDELPVALGDDDDLSLPEAPLDDEPLVLCAMETLASANRAAAVAVPMIFNI